MALTIQRSDLLKYARNNGYEALDAVAKRRYYRAIENGLRMVSAERSWEFLTTTKQIITTAPYSTGTVDTAGSSQVGDTSIDIDGATLPSDIVSAHAFIEIDNGPQWYEITERTDDDTLVIRSPGLMETVSNKTYQIVYPLYDLPAEFREMRAVYNVTRGGYMHPVEVPEMWWLHANTFGTSQPRGYTLVQARHDPNIMQIMLWPAPGSTREGLEISYVREAGWYDTAVPATSTFKLEATADTDYLDWPDKMRDLLYAGVMLCLSEELQAGDAGAWQRAYYQKLAKYKANDQRDKSLRRLSDGNGGGDPYHHQFKIPGDY